MGAKTDQTIGRAKQAVGAVTGDEETKREGQRQEDKGKLKRQARLDLPDLPDVQGDHLPHPGVVHRIGNDQGFGST